MHGAAIKITILLYLCWRYNVIFMYCSAISNLRHLSYDSDDEKNHR